MCTLTSIRTRNNIHPTTLHNSRFTSNLRIHLDSLRVVWSTPSTTRTVISILVNQYCRTCAITSQLRLFYHQADLMRGPSLSLQLHLTTLTSTSGMIKSFCRLKHALQGLVSYIRWLPLLPQELSLIPYQLSWTT